MSILATQISRSPATVEKQFIVTGLTGGQKNTITGALGLTGFSPDFVPDPSQVRVTPILTSGAVVVNGKTVPSSTAAIAQFCGFDWYTYAVDPADTTNQSLTLDVYPTADITSVLIEIAV